MYQLFQGEYTPLFCTVAAASRAVNWPDGHFRIKVIKVKYKMAAGNFDFMILYYVYELSEPSKDLAKS